VVLREAVAWPVEIRGLEKDASSSGAEPLCDCEGPTEYIETVSEKDPVSVPTPLVSAEARNALIVRSAIRTGRKNRYLIAIPSGWGRPMCRYAV
jgi:hypothetical protein